MKMKRNEILENIINRFKSLQPFNKVEDILELPNIGLNKHNEVIVPNLIRCGAIPKKDLIIGRTYIGNCRNSHEATWNGKSFDYRRYKFGTTFDDTINHFEDDDGYDLFVPWKIKDE